MPESNYQTDQADITPGEAENALLNVPANMPAEKILSDLADFFKIFGDATRIKILYALFASELCVQDLAALLNMNQSAISHQLRILKQAKVVKYRKDGKYAVYALDDEHVTQIVAQGIAHLSEK